MKKKLVNDVLKIGLNTITRVFTNRKLLSNFPFYKGFLENPNIKEQSKAFKIYAIYEVLDSRDSAIQFYVTKTYVENKFKGLIVQMYAFNLK